MAEYSDTHDGGDKPRTQLVGCDAENVVKLSIGVVFIFHLMVARLKQHCCRRAKALWFLEIG